MSSASDTERVVVISLDYDGCGDVLFDSPSILEDYHSDPRIRSGRKKLSCRLNEDTEGAAIVDLYVGSNRQSHKRDKFNSKHNKNGPCFSNYEKLAKDQGWTFQKLLLADSENNQPAGRAMMPGSRLNCIFDKLKIETIQGQLKDAVGNHPGQLIDFYFYDDDYHETILPALLMGLEIPKNVTLHLVKYDWQMPGAKIENFVTIDVITHDLFEFDSANPLSEFVNQYIRKEFNLLREVSPDQLEKLESEKKLLKKYLEQTRNDGLLEPLMSYQSSSKEKMALATNCVFAAKMILIPGPNQPEEHSQAIEKFRQYGVTKFLSYKKDIEKHRDSTLLRAFNLVGFCVLVVLSLATMITFPFILPAIKTRLKNKDFNPSKGKTRYQEVSSNIFTQATADPVIETVSPDDTMGAAILAH